MIWLGFTLGCQVVCPLSLNNLRSLIGSFSPFKCWCHKLLISVIYFAALREWYTTECKGSANILNCANPLEETLINFKQLWLFKWQKTLDCHLLGIHKCQQIISRVWLWTISTPRLQRYCRISLKLLTGHHY